MSELSQAKDSRAGTIRFRVWADYTLDGIVVRQGGEFENHSGEAVHVTFTLPPAPGISRSVRPKGANS